MRMDRISENEGERAGGTSKCREAKVLNKYNTMYTEDGDGGERYNPSGLSKSSPRSPRQ